MTYVRASFSGKPTVMERTHSHVRFRYLDDGIDKDVECECGCGEIYELRYSKGLMSAEERHNQLVDEYNENTI